MAVVALATPAELRRWLGLDPGDTAALTDDNAALLLAGVSKQVIAYVTRDPEAETLLVDEEGETIRVDGNGAGELVLPRAPVVAVSKVVADPDGADPVVMHEPAGTPSVTGDVEWSRAGILRLVNGGRWANRLRYYEVTYRAGYETVPEDVRNVVLRVSARAFSNPEGLATEGVGGYNAGFAFDDTRLPTLSAPDRRELDPYRL